MKLKKGLKAVEMAEATIAPILKATAPPITTPPITQPAQPIQRVVSSGKDKFEITLDPPESPPVIRGPFNRIKIEPKSKNTPNPTQSTTPATPTNIQNASKILAYVKNNIDVLSVEDIELLTWRATWLAQARPNQLPTDMPWDLWVMLFGRGAGKTRVGVQWLTWQCLKAPDIRGAVISPTSSDVRDTVFEGESGIISVVPESLVATYNRSLNEVVFKNGSRIKGYSAQEADRLRGPQHHYAMLDEYAAFGSDLKDPADSARKARDVMDMLRFGLRLGKHPQILIATTPKPVPHVRDLIKQSEKAPEKIIIVRGSTYENKANLAPSFFSQIAQYEGTQLGRQEIHAEMLDPEESGVIKRSWFQLWKNRDPLPKIEYVIQSYDTAYTDKTQNDPTACTTWGIFEHKGEKAVMLLDCWTDHLKFDDLVAKMRESYNALYGDPGRKPDVLLIEDKGSGISVQQTLQRLGLPVHTYNPGRADKLQRLHSVSHYFANGKVVLPESMLRSGQPRDWCEELVGQLCAFPLVDHDDLVDSTTSALALIRDQEWLMIDKYRDEAEVVDFDYYKRRKTGTNPYTV